MERVFAPYLILGEKYYIKSVDNDKSRQIAICKKVTHINNDLYIVDFIDISEIKKKNGYGYSGRGSGEGYRHSNWFKFYKVYSIKYNNKIETLYNNTINTYLKQITGDCNFIWYT